MWRSSVRTRAGLRVVRLEGHIDAAAEGTLHRRLSEDVTGGDVARIHLDLRGVSGLGASGAAVLVAAAFAGRAAGRSVRLGRCRPAVLEVLRHTGALNLIGAGTAAPSEPSPASADRRVLTQTASV
jgi:anti-anti-sigma factor